MGGKSLDSVEPRVNGRSVTVPGAGRLLGILAVLAFATACSAKPDAPLAAASAEAARPNAERNELFITADDRVIWNGRSVTDAELAELLRATSKLDPQPELAFRPDAGSDYAVSAKVLGMIKDAGFTGFSFIGNEAYSSSDKPSN